jgi:hypothetical protein
MKFLSVFTSFLLTETKEWVLVLAIIGDWHVSEAGCEALKDLLQPLVHEEKLHMAANLAISSLINSYQITPFICGVNSVTHDLSVGKLGLLIKYLCWGCCIVDITMVDRCLTNDSQLGVWDPSPVPHDLIDIELLHFSFRIEIEDLNYSLGSLSGT